MLGRIVVIGALALAIGGCASSNEEQKSTTRGDNAARERAFQFSGGDTLQQRATFDLGCAVEQLQAQVLQRVGMFQVATSVGVRGCGRQATYMRSEGTSMTWVLNGPVMSLPPPAEPQQAPPPPPPQQ